MMKLFDPVPDDRIRSIQVETLYKNIHAVFFANLVNTVLFCLVLWQQVDSRYLLIWAGVLLALTALRAVMTWRYWHDAQRDVRLEKWLLRFMLATMMSGLLWGIAGFVFYLPEGGVYQAFLVIFLLGIGAGGMAFLSAHLPTFFGFFGLLTLPLVIRMLMVGDMPHLVMASMVVVYMMVFMVFGRNVNRMLLDSILLRFDNLDMVEQLTKEKELAEKANIAKSKFLAAASHDLRQPLHALSLLAGALAERIQYAEVKSIVDKIRAAVAALENLFNALLDISKLDSGILQPCIENFELRVLFDRIENDYRPEAEQKGLEFEVQDCGGVVVKSDAILLERILRNFVSNAVRYTGEGRMSVRCEPQADQIVIRVRDTGMGIPAAAQELIFDEYVQLDNPERDREKGLGLGLAIVARIARLLGHEIDLCSEAGKGSEFVVHVPVGEAVNLVNPDVPNMPEFKRDLNGVKVLVIDDESAILDALTVLLEGWGCEVVAAESVEVARQLLQKQATPPDAILSDYRLREHITGVEAIKTIEAMYGKEIPALLITGDLAILQVAEESAQPYRVLQKPVQPARLRAFLKHVQGQQQPEVAAV